MSKITTKKPVIVTMYGFPGSGKSYFGRQFAEEISAAYLHNDRIRSELFENPRYDKQEDEIVENIMEYMATEFLSAGISVVYDSSTYKISERRRIREFAHKAKASVLLIWFQIDLDSSLERLSKRDKRRADDKFARDYNENILKSIIGKMQNPQPTENYAVVSGKHVYNTQKQAIIKKMYELGYLNIESYSSNMKKPGMVNLVPNKIGRVDLSRRNISIR